ncbi:MAG TPA: T9SS type A sorting domain-containing protein [Chitinophagales bacterium]|nr:T9SS type A sorting domain-containing protein [Chitinophagales bacterium]
MKVIIFFILFLTSLSLHAQNWTNAFIPGQYDINGQYLGGTEVMALVTHKGKLYAATSYVCDLDNATYDLSGGTPILVLDSANAEWKQDVLFSDLLLIPSLKEIIFTKDYQGNSIGADTVLITGPNNKNYHIFIYARNDATGTWIKDSITTLTGKIEIRSIGTHYDSITGHQYVFIGVSNFGIWKGEYNASLPSKIQWESVPEFLIPDSTRVTAMSDVNGVMYVGTTESNSWTSKIFRRADGPVPVYNQIFSDTAPVGLDMRGFTPVKNATGTGYDLWFYWNDYFRRLEPQNNDSIVNELNVSSDLSLESGRVFSGIITAAFNDHQLFWKDPATNDTLLLIGLQAMYDSTWLSSNPHPNIAGRSIDGMYYSRKQDSSTITYQLHYIVNNTPDLTDTLLASRTICISPFAADSNKVLYAGGFNTNSVPLNNTAWIYKGNFSDVATPINSDLQQGFPISIFPNPAQQSFTIDLSERPSDLVICDIAGKKVYERKNFSGQAEIDCKDFLCGIYFVHITTDKQSIYNQKIVVANY